MRSKIGTMGFGFKRLKDSYAVFFFSVFLCFLNISEANEKIGVFAVDDLQIRSSILSQENVGADFSMVDSLFSLRWRKNERYSAKISVGSELTRNLPIFYSATNEDSLGLIEGYAELSDYYGQFRAGLIPLEFGYDGSISLYNRMFQPSLFFSNRLVGWSDHGVSFYTENRGYFTKLILHNGEIDTESDGRIWTTGLWGYTNERNFKTQLSMQSGYVKGSVSSTSTNSIAGVINGETARWRNGLLFVNWYPKNWNIVLEYGGGELDQLEKTKAYETGLLEVTRKFTDRFWLGARYNTFDPNRKTSGDQSSEGSLMLAILSADATSRMLLVGTKKLEESGEIPNDQLRLVWLLTPYAQ